MAFNPKNTHRERTQKRHLHPKIRQSHPAYVAVYAGSTDVGRRVLRNRKTRVKEENLGALKPLLLGIVVQEKAEAVQAAPE